MGGEATTNNSRVGYQKGAKGYKINMGRNCIDSGSSFESRFVSGFRGD